MTRIVLTGAPGSGKTSLLRGLAALGYATVNEAATDVITSRQARGIDAPWEAHDFIDRIVELQLQRLEERPAAAARVEIHDRSLFCTLALAEYAEREPPPILRNAIERATRLGWYDTRVLMIRPVGAPAPTAARRISPENAIVFERIHEDVYVRHGFTLVEVPPMPLDERIARTATLLARWT